MPRETAPAWGRAVIAGRAVGDGVAAVSGAITTLRRRTTVEPSSKVALSWTM